jgi:hypothetical protein
MTPFDDEVADFLPTLTPEAMDPAALAEALEILAHEHRRQIGSAGVELVLAAAQRVRRSGALRDALVDRVALVIRLEEELERLRTTPRSGDTLRLRPGARVA